MGQLGTTLLDTVTRIYKNSDGKVIGLHCLGINERKASSPSPVPGDYPDLAERSKRGLKLNISFQRFNLDIGGSRVIDSVLMFGGYDDFVLNGSGDDLLQITYYGIDDENDLIVALGDFPTVGSTV